MLICIRVLNKRTNLGKIYLVNTYIIIVNNKKLNITWFTKKKGISCGIIIIYLDWYNSLSWNKYSPKNGTKLKKSETYYILKYKLINFNWLTDYY